MDALNSQAAWDEATGRVTAYLDRLQIGGAEHRTRHTLAILTRARQRCTADPGLAPVEAAMIETLGTLNHWYDQALPGATVESGMTAARVVGIPRSWPDAVLSEPIPPPLRRELAAVTIPPGPELTPSSMAAREMDFGAMETLAQETWQKFDWAPVLRAAALWTGIFFLCLFLHDHFFAP